MSEVSLRGLEHGIVRIHYNGHDFNLHEETFQACMRRGSLEDYLDHLINILGHEDEQSN